jgi:hypothetical protein
VDQKSFEGRMTAAVIMMHRELLRRETRGPGDTEGAMRRLEARYGLDYWTQWGIRYRPPTEIRDRSLIERIRQAYLDALQRSVRRDLEAFKAEEAKGKADADLESLMAESEALLARIAARKAPVT